MTPEARPPAAAKRSRCCWSRYHLVKRVREDARRTRLSELGHEFAFDAFFEDNLQGDPFGIGEAGDGGALFRRQQGQDCIQAFPGNVHFQAHLLTSFQGPLEQDATYFPKQQEILLAILLLCDYY